MKQKIFSLLLFTALFAGVSIDASAHKHTKYCKHGGKHYKHGYSKRGHRHAPPAPVVVAPPRPPAPGHLPLPPHPPLPPGAPRPPMPPLPR